MTTQHSSPMLKYIEHFHEGAPVWVSDPHEAWIPAIVVSIAIGTENTSQIHFQSEADGHVTNSAFVYLLLA